MFDKKYKIEDLHVGTIGMVLSSGPHMYVKDKTHVFLTTNSNNEYVDLLTNKTYKTFKQNPHLGQIVINDSNLCPAKELFNHPKMLIINVKTIINTIKELNKPNYLSKFGKCYVDVCKYNKISHREIFEHIKNYHKKFRKEEEMKL